MTGTQAATERGMAILPTPTPDAEFSAVYDRAAERLTTPGGQLAGAVRSIRLGDAVGCFDETDMAGIRKGSVGIEHACGLAARVEAQLVQQARQKAERLVAQAGLTVPDDFEPTMRVTPHEHETGVWTLTADSYTHLVDLAPFLDSAPPAPVRNAVLPAVDAMTQMSVIASLFPVLLECDELTRFGALYYCFGGFCEPLEEYVFGDEHASAEQAWAEIEHGMDTQDVSFEDFEVQWNEAHKLFNLTREHFPGMGNPEYHSVTAIRAAVRHARQAGYDHPALAYAEAIANLAPEVEELLHDIDCRTFESVDAHQMLVVTTTPDEIEILEEACQCRMEGSEPPTVYFPDPFPESCTGDAETGWNRMVNLIAACYAQTIAFACCETYGLIDAYQEDKAQC